MSTITITEAGGLLGVVLEHPVLAVTVLEELRGVLEDLSVRGRPGPLVLSSAHPEVFTAGAHLGEIARLDVADAGRYADLGRSLLARLETWPGPTVAAVDGSCSGGGFDLVLACDAVAASPRATFRHPGVLRGLVTGWSGTTRLPWQLGRPPARAAVLTARELSAPELARAGLALMLADEPLDAARQLARRLARLEPTRLGLWRRLRHGRFVDRFRASVVHSD